MEDIKKFELTFIGNSNIWVDKHDKVMTYWYRIDGRIDKKRTYIYVQKFKGRLCDELNEKYWDESVHNFIESKTIEIADVTKPKDLVLIIMDEAVKLNCIEDCRYYINNSFAMNSPGKSIPRWSITLGAPSYTGGNEQWVFMYEWLGKYCELYMK